MKPNSTLPKIIANERVDVMEDWWVFYGDKSDGRPACCCKKTKSQFYQNSSLTNAMMVWRTGNISTELDPMIGGRCACLCKKTRSQFYQSSSLNNAMMGWRTPLDN